MNTILYMGISINGYIAKADGDSEWTSDEDLKGFYEGSKRAGNIVMGKNTYLAAMKSGYFPFPDALNIVVTHEQIENRWGDERVLITDRSPNDVARLLEEKGFQTLFLAGGGQLNTSFMKDHLINEIYLDVEPLIFGRGIPIFADSDFETELELIETKQINPNTVQLHYRVKT